MESSAPRLSESFEQQHMERATDKLRRELSTPQGEAILREQVHHQRGLQANLHVAWQKTREPDVLKMLLSHFSDTSPTMHRDLFIDLTTSVGMALQEGLAAFQDIDVVQVNRIAALQLRNWCARVDHPFNVLQSQFKKPISLEELRSARDILVQLTSQEARVTARRRFEELRVSAVELAKKKQSSDPAAADTADTTAPVLPPQPLLSEALNDEQSVTSAQKYLTIFQYFDRDGDGRLNLSEVNDFTALTEGEGAAPCSPAEWRDLCQSRCLDPDKGLALSDLIAIYESQQGDLSQDYVVVRSHMIRDSSTDPTPPSGPTPSSDPTPPSDPTPSSDPTPPSGPDHPPPLPPANHAAEAMDWDTPGGHVKHPEGGGAKGGFHSKSRRPWTQQLGTHESGVKVSRALELPTLADRPSNFLFEHDDACSSSMEWVSLVQANQNGFQNNMFEAMSSKMPNPNKGPLQCGGAALDTQEWAEVGASIAAGAFNQIGPIMVLRVGAVMEWKFAVTDGKDIEFAILFTNGTYVPEPLLMTSNVGEGVQKSCRLRGVVRGSHTFQRAGMAFLRWSNSYSWMRSREVRYRVRLRNPPLHENNSILRRIRTEFKALASSSSTPKVEAVAVAAPAPSEEARELAQTVSALREQLDNTRRNLQRARDKRKGLGRALRVQRTATVAAILSAHQPTFRLLLPHAWESVQSAFTGLRISSARETPSKSMVWETTS